MHLDTMHMHTIYEQIKIVFLEYLSPYINKMLAVFIWNENMAKFWSFIWIMIPLVLKRAFPSFFPHGGGEICKYKQLVFLATNHCAGGQY